MPFTNNLTAQVLHMMKLHRKNFGLLQTVEVFRSSLSCEAYWKRRASRTETLPRILMSSASLSSGLPVGGPRSDNLDAMRKETKWPQTQTP